MSGPVTMLLDGKIVTVASLHEEIAYLREQLRAQCVREVEEYKAKVFELRSVTADRDDWYWRYAKERGRAHSCEQELRTQLATATEAAESALAARDAEIEKLRGLLREVRMYALGNDVSTQLLMERVDAALAERGE